MWLVACLFKLRNFVKLGRMYNPVATTNIQHRLYRVHRSIPPAHEINIYCKIRTVLPNGTSRLLLNCCYSSLPFFEDIHRVSERWLVACLSCVTEVPDMFTVSKFKGTFAVI